MASINNQRAKLPETFSAPTRHKPVVGADIGADNFTGVGGRGKAAMRKTPGELQGVRQGATTNRGWYAFDGGKGPHGAAGAHHEGFNAGMGEGAAAKKAGDIHAPTVHSPSHAASKTEGRMSGGEFQTFAGAKPSGKTASAKAVRERL